MDDDEKNKEFREFAGARAADRPEKGGGFLRGCAMAIGIALLILAFVIGACFISMS